MPCVKKKKKKELDFTLAWISALFGMIQSMVSSLLSASWVSMIKKISKLDCFF